MSDSIDDMAAKSRRLAPALRHALPVTANTRSQTRAAAMCSPVNSPNAGSSNRRARNGSSAAEDCRGRAAQHTPEILHGPRPRTPPDRPARDDAGVQVTQLQGSVAGLTRQSVGGSLPAWCGRGCRAPAASGSSRAARKAARCQRGAVARAPECNRSPRKPRAWRRWPPTPAAAPARRAWWLPAPARPGAERHRLARSASPATAAGGQPGDTLRQRSAHHRTAVRSWTGIRRPARATPPRVKPTGAQRQLPRRRWAGA